MPLNRKNTKKRRPAAKTQSRRPRTPFDKPQKKRASAAHKPARKQNVRAASKAKAPVRTGPASNSDSATMLYFCAAVLLIIFAAIGLAGGINPFTQAITGVLHGLTGTFILPLALMFIWMGARRCIGPEKQGSRGTDELPPLLTYILFVTVWEAFEAESLLGRMEVDSYINFIKYAFEAKAGGGALGALLGYWGNKLNPWLTALIALMLELLMLNGRGYFSFRGIGESVQKGAQGVRQQVQSVRRNIEVRRALYNDDKKVVDPDPGKDVEVRDLDEEYKTTRARMEARTRELKSAGDRMHIDTAAEPEKTEKKSYKGESGESRRTGGSVYSERVEKPEEEPKKKPGAAGPERKSKPEPKHEPKYEPEYEPEEEPDVTGAPDIDDIEDEPDDYETPEFVERPHKEPQQPKPSFFDGGAKGGPTIRQKSDQGRTVQEARADVKRTATVADLDRDNPEAGEPYHFPELDLLETGAHTRADTSSDSDMQRGQLLVEILSDFNIPVKLVGVSHGPAVTRLEILPDPGIKVSRISQYADDIQMGLEVKSVRIEAPIPGKRAVGVEIPNPRREIVNLRDVLESKEAATSKKKLLVALGKDNSGNYVLADLAGMPHVLIAGQTGSGKSICINAIIISLLYRYTPDEVRMIMVDPKMVELNVYNTIPHLLIPVVTDPQKAAGALDWAVMEMTRRYKVFKDAGTKNIETYNQHLPEGEKPMPRIVIIIDELADLMMVAKHDVEESINRLAQLARAAGMHLVIATQRPSVNVITGLIKANIPTRIAFAVASGTDSTCILDCYGAEKLLGRGDMLYAPADSNKPTRMQGAWVSEDEVQRVVDHIASQQQAEFDEEILDHLDKAASTDADRKDKQDAEAAEDTDPLLEEAVRAVVEAGQASISMLQRKLKVGYPRAGKLIDMMEQRGFVSKGEGSKAREVIISREDLNSLFGHDDGEDSDDI